MLALAWLAPVDPEAVCRTWRVRGRDRQALGALQRSLGPAHNAKRYAVVIGATLAHAELRASLLPPMRRRAREVTRTIHHARAVLSDHAPMRPVPVVEPTTPAPASARRPDVTALQALALSPDQRRMVRAILDEQASTFAEVDRLFGWSHGQAAKQAERIRKKATAA